MEDADGLGFLTAFTEARAKKGERFSSRPAGEGIQQRHVICIIKRHFPFLTVQENPNPARWGHHSQWRLGLRAGRVLAAIAQPEGPVPILRAQLDSDLTIH